MTRHSNTVRSRGRSVGECSQINVRMPQEMIDRVRETAVLLGMDFSTLLRYLVLKHLPEFESQARPCHRQGLAADQE